MPITLPPFAQYQGTLFPLRGLWNAPPAEGDRFVNAEIDWGTLTAGVSCVQFQLSGNSPVAFSQIVAMSVDNSRCGVDIDFVFPDSGFVLTVPAFNQGVYPVFTNALMFYANGVGANVGDRTIIQILNSMPPPVAIQPSAEQQHTGAGGLNLSPAGSTPIIAAVNGTLNAFSISIGSVTSATTGTAVIGIQDGTGAQLWTGEVSASNTGPFELSGLHIPFSGGLFFTVFSSTISSGVAIVNLYYSVP